MGKGAFALAVVGIGACSPAAVATSQPARASAGPNGGAGSAASAAPGSTTATGSANPPGAGAVAWERVNLGFVSAFVLVRGGEAAIVDTGVSGSADEIEASIRKVDLDWSAVGHLILTHHHGDHQGSAPDVLERAPDATGYAGAEAIPPISVPRPLTSVGDGDDVFGLKIVTAPGHTAGSICVLDPAGGFLVAGDALRTDGGRAIMPREGVTADMEEAKRSVAKLGKLTFDTLLVGHGDPLVDGAAASVAELVAAG